MRDELGTAHDGHDDSRDEDPSNDATQPRATRDQCGIGREIVGHRSVGRLAWPIVVDRRLERGHVLLLDLFSLSEELVMKSIVVRSAVASLRLPLLALAIIAGPGLRAVAFFAALPVLVVRSAFRALLDLDRLVVRGIWLLARSTLAVWLRPWLVAFRLLRFSLLVIGWVARRVIG